MERKACKTGNKAAYAIGASLLALIVGGSQYTTGLLAVIGTVFLFAFVNRKIKWQQIIPGIFLMIGFGISMCSPGNSMRQSGTTGMAPVKAILLSFVQAVQYTKEWITPFFVVIVLFYFPLWENDQGEQKEIQICASAHCLVLLLLPVCRRLCALSLWGR